VVPRRLPRSGRGGRIRWIECRSVSDVMDHADGGERERHRVVVFGRHIVLVHLINRTFTFHYIQFTHNFNRKKKEVPVQTKETTWPLGKVAFSLLPLAGSYSRRATGEFRIIFLCRENEIIVV
jgi:Txe/YoeB family toxin of Txe-Axe toxin-antitoxin module